MSQSEWTNDQSIRVEALNIASREATIRSYGTDDVSRNGLTIAQPKKTIVQIAAEIYEFINQGEPK